MSASPSSPSSPKSLVFSAVTDALMQCGWPPPPPPPPPPPTRVPSSEYHQNCGSSSGLLALSASSLTALQEDIARLHSSDGENKEAGYENLNHAEGIERSAAVVCDGDKERSGNWKGGRVIGVFKHTPRNGRGQTYLLQPSDTTDTAPSSSDRVNTTLNSSNNTPSFSHNRPAAPRNPSLQNPVSISTAPRTLLPSTTKYRTHASPRNKARNNPRSYRTLADAPPLSDDKITDAQPLRPRKKRAVAADFFTPRSSPTVADKTLEHDVTVMDGKDGKREVQGFSMDDVIELIEEEKARVRGLERGRGAVGDGVLGVAASEKYGDEIVGGEDEEGVSGAGRKRKRGWSKAELKREKVRKVRGLLGREVVRGGVGSAVFMLGQEIC